MTDLSTDQQPLPGVPRAEMVIRVHVHPENRLLRVDTIDWERMSVDERDEYVYDACLELGWFEIDFAEATR